MAYDVRAVVFDVNETLFSLQPLAGAFDAAGLDPAQVPLWFARLLRDGFALAAMGRHRTFGELAAEALRGLAPGRVGPGAVEAVLGALRTLDPHPDVLPGLRMLHDAGMPAVTLTTAAPSSPGYCWPGPVSTHTCRTGTRPTR